MTTAVLPYLKTVSRLSRLDVSCVNTVARLDRNSQSRQSRQASETRRNCDATGAEPEGQTMTELCDYCRTCVTECGCGRTDTLTDPFQIDWDGTGSMLTAWYLCGCGHVWTCHWSPELLDAKGMGG